MGWFGAKAQQLDAEQQQRCDRRCKRTQLALAACLAANTGAASERCKGLREQLQLCLSEVLCPEGAAAFTQCYHSVVNSGAYQGATDCSQHAARMHACLRKFQLPVYTP